MTAITALGKFWAGVFTFDAGLIKEAISEAANVVYDSVSEIADGIEKNIGEALENTFTPKDKIELVTEEGLQQGIDDMLAPIKKSLGRHLPICSALRVDRVLAELVLGILI